MEPRDEGAESCGGEAGGGACFGLDFDVGYQATRVLGDVRRADCGAGAEEVLAGFCVYRVWAYAEHAGFGERGEVEERGGLAQRQVRVRVRVLVLVLVLVLVGNQQTCVTPQETFEIVLGHHVGGRL